MSESDSDRGLDLIHNIDEALARNPALTSKQLEDVRRLRAELRELCRSGKMEAAQRCEQLALAIIREGAPVSE